METPGFAHRVPHWHTDPLPHTDALQDPDAYRHVVRLVHRHPVSEPHGIPICLPNCLADRALPS